MYLYEATNQDFDWTLVTCRCHIFSMSTYHIQGTRSVKRSSNWRGSAPTSIHSLMSWFLCATKVTERHVFPAGCVQCCKEKTIYIYICIRIYIYSTEQLYCFRYSDIQVLQQQNIGTHPLGYALPWNNSGPVCTTYYLLYAICYRR